MNTKSLIWIGVFVGGTVGGALPLLWGADVTSMSAILLSTVGGLVGIWAGWKLGEMIGI